MQHGESGADLLVIAASHGGEGKPLRMPVEQLEAEMCLKTTNLLCNGALGYAQLFRGGPEIQVPPGGVEGFQRIDRWQAGLFSQ